MAVDRKDQHCPRRAQELGVEVAAGVRSEKLNAISMVATEPTVLVTPAAAHRPGAVRMSGTVRRAALVAEAGGQHTMGVSVDLSKALDKAYENKTLAEILQAPPSALAGLTEEHDKKLADALGIKTIADLGSNRFFALAGVLVALSGKTG